MLPGVGIGAVTGVFSGLVTLIAGLPWQVVAINAIAFGVPMALFAGVYTVLCSRGVLPVGVFFPAALYWMVGYPVSRIVQEGSAVMYVEGAPGLSAGVLAFFLYNALLAPGLAFGFIWLHERLVPHWLMRIRDHNREAAGLAEAYLSYAKRSYEQKQRRAAIRAHKKQRAVGA